MGHTENRLECMVYDACSTPCTKTEYRYFTGVPSTGQPSDQHGRSYPPVGQFSSRNTNINIVNHLLEEGFWAPVISSGGNLQLFVDKLRLKFLLRLLTEERHNYVQQSFEKRWAKDLICTFNYLCSLLRPQVIAFGADLLLAQMFFFVFIPTRDLGNASAISVKFCTLISSRPNFMTPVRNFGGPKHAKFGAISDDFNLWRRISPEQMQIFKIGQVYVIDRGFLRVWRQKTGELWSTNHGDLEVNCTHLTRLFRKNLFRPLRGAAPPNFYVRYRMTRSC